MRENGLPPRNALEHKVAAEHAFGKVPVTSPSASARQVQESLNEGIYNNMTHVAILEGSKLVGVLTIEALFAAPDEATAGRLMDPDPPVVAPGTDEEVAARRAVEQGKSALAAVEEGGFVGFIPPQRLLAVSRR